ncbi:ABC transporter permease [Streptomyces sp. FXY-T5]|uniref:ABC transporter permease n=1 Tax=Streptomyces sp. FXY-T5 TaxID=3064901 RepID=UPI0027D295BD|nr:ABC transporter permease [Streptomyces sp. FXY-T5]WMD09654.1 ABC transporter permease [Streptomyces sp. FXY-T5]
MTAVTGEAPVAARRFPGPRGLFLAMVRTHRTALWFWLGLVAVAAAALLWALGPGADAAWAEYREMGCHSGSPNLGCDLPGPAMLRYETTVTVVIGILFLLPTLTGAWAGGALIGRELEDGTAQLAWTQSVTPARWLAAKLAVPALLLVPGTLAVTLLHRALWSTHSDLARAMGWREWHDDGVFEANGTLATAHALTALAIGVLSGVLLRRALPALGVAVAAMASLTYVLDDLRPHLWPTPPGTPSLMHKHPSSHFWPLQLVETGIVMAVAALATATAFLVLRRRTGAAV